MLARMLMRLQTSYIFIMVAKLTVFVSISTSIVADYDHERIEGKLMMRVQAQVQCSSLNEHPSRFGIPELS